MKATGVTRKVDDLGRIVLPKELRRTLGIQIKDPIEIFVEKDKIILKKYSPVKACLITGEVSENNMVFGDGNIVLSPEGARILIDEIRNKAKENWV
ncbi:AbrB/MazE/SpoVT family DNA-binding domain-containing protein [Bacillus gobiensis]|uniref:AbrB/MazE/SpoVT family DNA-binding domain-containing protein n=1 Tax=Bacillus gobiensis TaxID=1441095 RepID=UPI003D1C2477